MVPGVYSREDRPGQSVMDVIIDEMKREDWDAVHAIHLEGIATGNATFERDVPNWEAWDSAHRKDCRLVARRKDGEVLGWVALSPASGRCVYAGVASLSVYVTEGARGRGVGKALLSAAIDASEREGIWTLEAGVFPENEASIALHTSCGFRVVGRRERIGQMDGVWRDTLLMERRSSVVGL
jgi:L-amino acid N-acyltransferase YncA